MVRKLEWAWQVVKVADIRLPFNTLRSEFDEETESDFCSSVRNLGVVEPIKLIKLQETTDPGLYLTDGKHRLAETIRQNRETIEAYVANGTMADLYDLNVTLNLLRGHTDPWQLALLVDFLAQTNTLEELAQRWHMTVGYLSQLRNIYSNREVFNAWKDRKINFHEARNIVYQVNNDGSNVNRLLQDIILGKEKLSDESNSAESRDGDGVDDERFVGRCDVCGQIIGAQQSTFLKVHKTCTSHFFEALEAFDKKNRSHAHDKKKQE